MSPVRDEVRVNIAADIVIVGGGGAGLAAAVTAAENGAGKVVVLEKRGATGGNTALSSGMFAAESPAQKRQAIDARRDYFFKILTDFAHWKINPRLIRLFIDRSADTIRWLEKKGLFFEVFPMYPGQIATWHQARGNRGAEVMKTLLEECRSHGVTLMTNTPATKIVLGEDGEAKGVIAQSQNREIFVSAAGIIIATGGYGGNKQLMKQYCPLYRDNMRSDGLLHNGDGLLMALEIGANTEGLGVMLMSGPQIPNAITLEFGDPPDKTAPLMAIALEPNTLWVNNLGQRFTDETVSFNHYVSSNTVNRQPDNLCYTLLDQGLVQTMAEEGLITGLSRSRVDQRTKMPGLEKALQKQVIGYMTVEQADPELCNGCGICIDSCPVGAISLDTSPKGRTEFSACRLACPAGVDMRRYLNLVKTGRIDEAYRVLREFLPLPAVTGRVCPHFCENECARRDVDEAVNINSLERFVADYGRQEKASRISVKYNEKVAIVGSGPAGLSCAYFLIGMGYPVTIFEAMPVLGGMLRLGIPEYRLPGEVLDEQIDYIRDMGVEFRKGVAVGRDITFEELRRDYAAVFWATGNQLSRKIEIEGSGLDGVSWGLDFLRDVKLGKGVNIADKVVVVGGGNVAVDAALSARKLGAKEVRMVCLETGNDIPAYPEEIRQAVAEGIEILEGWGPQKILGNGRGVNGIQLVKCTRVYDTDGRFAPQYDPGNTRVLETAAVVLAIGQAADHVLYPDGMELTDDGRVKVNPVSLETSLPGLFAGGDIVADSSSVVQAIADGKKAAVSLDLYLRGEDLIEGRGAKPLEVTNPPGKGIPQAAREVTPQIPAVSAAGGFREIKPGFDEESAYREVQRCMTCGSRSVITYVEECRLCKGCETSCPVQAIYPAPVRRIEPHVKIAGNWEEIAAWIGTNPEVLKATVEEYNQACEHGRDGLFAKDPMYMVPLRTPPYYAIKSNSDYLDTIGGIKVTERLEVLNKQDQPIKGLYAAGVIAGGWQHDTYCVVLSGAASGFAINSGRMAAENALEAARIHK